MRVRLIHAIRIGAVVYRAGSVLEVPKAAAEWLLGRGLAVPARAERETAIAPIPERAIAY